MEGDGEQAFLFDAYFTSEGEIKSTEKKRILYNGTTQATQKNQKLIVLKTQMELKSTAK